jgi:3-hydroxyisobutyrate dehydrogenase-like beta-hydroxyacid dehydrogenase
VNFAIGFIGFGEVGSTLADDLLPRGASVVAWDVLFADPQSPPSRAAAAQRVRVATNAANAVEHVDLVISAVTAAQTRAAAAACATDLAAGTFFLDLNSASPQVKIAAATLINAAGGRYVEAAVMSPIAPKRIATRLLLGGPHADAIVPLAHDLGFSGASVYSKSYGQAAAAKLCRSVIVKGMEALLTESLLAARQYGVEDAVLDSLSDLFPGHDWQHHARYMIARSIKHGARRAEEMREAAETVAVAGLEPLMSEACVAHHDWAARFPAALEENDLRRMLDHVRTAMQEKP